MTPSVIFTVQTYNFWLLKKMFYHKDQGLKACLYIEYTYIYIYMAYLNPKTGLFGFVCRYQSWIPANQLNSNPFLFFFPLVSLNRFWLVVLRKHVRRTPFVFMSNNYEVPLNCLMSWYDVSVSMLLLHRFIAFQPLSFC